MALPDFVIVGAQKSGSTALMKRLTDHPEIFLPTGETRHFRDPWYQFENSTVLEEAVAGASRGVLRRGIKCPDLLGEEPCAERIRDVLGSPSLIAVLREPVQRAISAYFWLMQWGFLPLAEPNEGLIRLLNGEYDRDCPYARTILGYGEFGRHIARFHRVFGPEKLLVLTDESLRSDPQASLRQVFRHLRVREDVPLVATARTVNSGVYSMRRLRVLRHRHKYIQRAYPGYESYGKFLQPAVGFPDRAFNRVIAAWDRLILARVLSNDRPHISPTVLNMLAAYYADDLRLLGEITDIDVEAWRSRYENI